MSSLVTNATETSARSGALDGMGTAIGLTLVVLLIVVLIERELIRILPGAHAAARVRALGIVSIPLLLTAAAVIVSRLTELT